jgi:hypothetical protein
MRDFAEYHGGLGLTSNSGVRLQKVARTVRFSLEKQGFSVDVSADLTAQNVVLVSNACTVKVVAVPGPFLQDENDTYASLDAEDDNAVQAAIEIDCRIEIKLTDCVRGDAESLLAFLMIDLVRAHAPKCVEWLEPGAQLPAEEFLSFFEMQPSADVVQPRRAIRTKPARRFASLRAAAKAGRSAFGELGCQFVPHTNGLDWPDAQVALAQAYRIPLPTDILFNEDCSPSDVLRLATWAIAGTIALIALPVAITMMIINLLRGEDFRLNTQALALSGLMVVLHTNGAFTDVMSLLAY